MEIRRMSKVRLLGGGLVLFLVIAICSEGVAEGQLGPWTYTSSLVTARRAIGVAAYNGYIYVVGGTSTNGPLASVEYARIKSNGSLSAFAYTSQLSTARQGVGVAVYNGYIYAVGGQPSSCSNIVEYAKINTDGTLGPWSITSYLNQARTNNDFVVTNNGYIYVLGGADCLNVQSSVEYARINADGSLGQWSFTSSMNVHRNGLGVATYNGYIYAAGATYGLRTVEYVKVNADGSLGQWSFTSSMNTIGHDPAVVESNGYLYAVGGADATPPYGGDPVPAVEYAQINPDGTLSAWLDTSKLNTARIDHNATDYNGYIYAIGGWDNNGTLLHSVEVAELVRLPSDLVIQDLTIEPIIWSDSWARVRFTIRNQGSGTSNDSTTNVRLAPSSSKKVNKNHPLLASIDIPSINAGGTVNIDGLVMIPPKTKQGNYSVWVIADANDTANQSDTKNDFANTPFSVTQKTSNVRKINGKGLSIIQNAWVQFVAYYVVPQLHGDRASKLDIASRVTWWGLEEGIFDFDPSLQEKIKNPKPQPMNEYGRYPFSFSNCYPNENRRDALQHCDPFDDKLIWQVGLAGVQVLMTNQPSETNHRIQEVQDTIELLWPGREPADVLAEAVTLAGFDPNIGIGARIVSSNDQDLLRTSWLLRHPVVGFTLEDPVIIDWCIDDTKCVCAGPWPCTKRNYPFSYTKSAVLTSISDLRAYLDELAP